MKIHDDHLYHGAALIQIAEHDKFTAINELKIGGEKYTNAYRINDGIAVYFKYSMRSISTYEEYRFNFKKDQLDSLEEISKHCRSTYLALVCVKDREVCCISYGQLIDLIETRKEAKGGGEDQYHILVTAPAGKGLRVYVNAPGVKGKMQGEPLIVPRSSFPDLIFE